VSVGFRSVATVTNGTAGTSVVVARPAGVVNGDLLLAFVAQAGTATVTAPTGWTLFGSQTTGGAVSLAVYWKVASSEPSSWTWTLGSSLRNWASVSAYTGVDPAAPINDSSSNTYPGAATAFALATYPQMLRFGAGVFAVAGVRTASGAATTWTPSGMVGITERADLSTNAGAGTDIAGEVSDVLNGTSPDASFTPSGTASLAQSAAVDWAIMLNPYWQPPLPAATVSSTLEAAFGADLTADPATWTWTDITARMINTAQISRGRVDEGQDTQPSKCTLRLGNTDGWLTPMHPSSPWYLLWDLGTPMRLKINQVIASFVRCQGRATRIDPVFPSGNSEVAFVDVEFQGLLYSMGQGEYLASPMHRAIAADNPIAYWSMEDASGAQSLAEASGGPPLRFVGGAPTTGSGGPVGSAPLVTLTTTSTLHGLVTMSAGVTAWTVEFYAKLTGTPAISTPIWEWHTGGTIRRWRLTIFPSGGVDTVGIEGFDKSDTRLIDFETSFLSQYNTDLVFVVAARQNGGNLEHEFAFNSPTLSAGRTGGSIAGTLGAISRVDTPFAGQVGWVYGHMSVYDRSLDVDADGDTWGSLHFNHWSYLDGDTGVAADQRILSVSDLTTNVNLRQDQAPAGTTSVMGPIPVASSPLTVMREAEKADLGVLTDGLNSGLDYLGKAYRYNRPVALALDGMRGHIKLPFEPSTNDQQLQATVTVSRSGGSSATAMDTAIRRAKGVYPSQVTLNLDTDADLANQTGQRLRMGTVSEMRSPTLTLDLRDKPELIRPWLERCDIGARYTAVSLPRQFGPNGLDQIIEQYVESIDAVTWTVHLTGAPFSPWRAFVTEDVLQGRGDTAGSSLHSGVSALATNVVDTWSVDTTAGPIWTATATTTNPNDFPFDVVCEGERVTVTAIVGASSPQTFTVKRAINGIVKAHSAAAPISLWAPPGTAF
jgi:hypothetical protein